MSDPLPPDVQAAIAQGRKIEAIKRLREAAGMDLKDAKDAVERHQRATTPHAAPAAIHPESRSGLWLVIALIAAALLAYALA